MNPYLVAMAIAGAILFHMGLLCLYIWLVMMAPILALALVLFWVAGWMILMAAYLSKK